MDMPKHKKPRNSKYGKQMNNTVRYVNGEEEDVLSCRGISPSMDKVNAVIEAREPETAAEVFGLVTYSSRFIPDLATNAAPFRELIKKHTVFKWSISEQQSCDELKMCLGNDETLGYYDKKAPA